MSQSDSDKKRVSRRQIVRTAGVAVTAPAFVNVATADTVSGHVEVQTTATVPADTSAQLTVYEDTNSSGSSNRQQTEPIPDGTATIEFDLLESTTAQGDVLWLMLELSTNDDSVTPSVDSVTITIPETVSTPTPTPEPGQQETPSQEPQNLGQIWTNYGAYVAFVTLAFTVIGAWSRSLTLGAWGGYMAFLYIAFETGTPLFENIALVTLVLVFLGFAFKLVRLEFGAE